VGSDTSIGFTWAAAAAEASQAADAERKRGWADTQQSVKHEVEERLRQLERMRSEAEREPDVLQKQLKLAECRELHAGLTQCSSNVKDVGTALGVVVGFLSGMDSKLDALGAQLSELQAAVRELGADMKRLVGKPVLELLDEQLKGRLAALQQLRAEVYIPAEGVRADDNGKFLVSDTNPAFDLMQEVKERFLQSEATSVLLLSGPAGSGACQARATLGLLWATGSSSGHNGWAPPLLFVVWAGP
jgi:chromosome segregation ATPase